MMIFKFGLYTLATMLALAIFGHSTLGLPAQGYAVSALFLFWFASSVHFGYLFFPKNDKSAGFIMRCFFNFLLFVATAYFLDPARTATGDSFFHWVPIEAQISIFGTTFLQVIYSALREGLEDQAGNEEPLLPLRHRPAAQARLANDAIYARFYNMMWPDNGFEENPWRL